MNLSVLVIGFSRGMDSMNLNQLEIMMGTLMNMALQAEKIKIEERSEYQQHLL